MPDLDLRNMYAIILIGLTILTVSQQSWAQDLGQPTAPIVLEWADSLVGTGGTAVGIREFIGNVRLRQGNVTVTCNRAVHNPSRNMADLFGDVIVRQDSMVLTAPYVHYEGNTHLATANGGITVTDTSRRVTADQVTYEMETRTARFTGKVHAVDDTSQLWSQHAVYYRTSGITTAWGTVVVWDSIGTSKARADSVWHDPVHGFLRLMGTAAVWDWDSAHADTMYILADTMEKHELGRRVIWAKGASEVVSGSVAARADSIALLDSEGRIELHADPVVWYDSTEILADTIIVFIPNRKLSEITGSGNGIIVSRADTVHPDRYDQISGRVVAIHIDADTIRQITAVEDARSITYKSEDERGEGLAKFTSDTIHAVFTGGELTDVYWLGGIEGEHQPEHLVTGKEANYLLPNFEWRSDRPRFNAPAQPWGPEPERTPVRVRPSADKSGKYQKNP